MHKTHTWHLLVPDPETLDFNQEHLAEIEVAGRRICIARAAGKFFACAAQCPHAAASLSGGYLNARLQIVCPLHAYKFSLENGCNVTGEGYPLKTYPLEHRADGWYIGLP